MVAPADASPEGRRVTGPRPTGGIPLTGLPTGRPGRVRSIAVDAPELLVKLSGLGLIPGANVVLEQRRPAAIVRVAHTSLALDPEIASRIFVDPL